MCQLIICAYEKGGKLREKISLHLREQEQTSLSMAETNIMEELKKQTKERLL